MLSSKVRVAAVLAGLLLAPVLSFAQGPGGGGRSGRGGFGGGGVTSLLAMEEVQKEISITDEQKAELAKLGEAARTAAGAGGAGGFDREAFQKLSEEERNKKFAEMRAAGEERAKKSEEAIKTLLKPEQWTRLGELRAQRDGMRAWSRAEVQKELGLTEEQIAKIKTLNEGQGQGGFGGPGGGRPNPDQSEEEARKAREERDAKRASYDKDMAAVLTADQTAAWTKMQGAKFEFPARGGFGGGTGGRGGRPGGATGNARPPAN